MGQAEQRPGGGMPHTGQEDGIAAHSVFADCLRAPLAFAAPGWGGAGRTQGGAGVYAMGHGTVVDQATGTGPHGPHIVLCHEFAEPVAWNGQAVTRVLTVYRHLADQRPLKPGAQVLMGERIGTLPAQCDPAIMHFGVALQYPETAIWNTPRRIPDGTAYVDPEA